MHLKRFRDEPYQVSSCKQNVGAQQQRLATPDIAQFAVEWLRTTHCKHVAR